MGSEEYGAVLNAFLRTLTPENRVVFLRRYYYVETAQEIARRYGIPVWFVTLRLKRTRRLLKLWLEKERIQNA